MTGTSDTNTVTSPNSNTAIQTTGRPGARALRVGCLASIIIVLIGAGAAIGLVVGAFKGDRVRETLAEIQRKVDGGNGHDHGENAVEQPGGYWTCGMHPWVILPEPGLCPICHMDLTPLDPSKLRGEIAIDPLVVQNIGVRIAPVMTGVLSPQIRTVGAIAYDETTVRDINTKIGGWIEKLYVDSEGAQVEKGQPLFDLYSPELYQAQEEYLLAWRAQQTRNPSNAGGIDLLDSARTRLKFFDVSEAQIRNLQDEGKPTKTLTVASPFPGIVIEKRATEGMRIEPDMRLYRIADLSSVWVMTTLYEHQLPLVRLNQPARMTLPFLPGETFEGRVEYIYPFLDEKSRQARVRLEFKNPEGALKPGMFATVELTSSGESPAVLVPYEAVTVTGRRRVAFVSLGDGRFEARDVKTGISSDGEVQILSGLEPGEMVVTSGQFLLDSESRMREALVKMVTGEMAADHRQEAAVVEVGELPVLSPETRAALNSLLVDYLAISEALAGDTILGVSAHASRITSNLTAVATTPPPASPHFWHERSADVTTIAEQAKVLARASDIGAARIAFGHLSDALDRIIEVTGVPPELGIPIDRRVCGMADDVPRSGVWLQPAEEDVRNPYFGSMMLRCNMPVEHRRLPVMVGAFGPVPATQQQGRQPQ